MVPLLASSLVLASWVWAGLYLVMTSTMGLKIPFIAVAVWPVTYLSLVWFIYRWPRTRYLIAHEHGISGKWPWWRFAVRFDDIECLQIGGKPSLLDKVLKITSVVDAQARDNLALREYAQKNAISLVLRDGRTISLGFLFGSFEDGDATKLVQFLSVNIPVKIAGAAS
ncbi:MAG: hypothetical protein HY289_02715 [Planctomycetes bacterium]|nr:hypothetical protein [Planctomycetota bacterium]